MRENQITKGRGMRCLKFMLAMAAIVSSAFIALDLSAVDSTQDSGGQYVDSGQNMGSNSDAMLKKLSIIIQNFKKDPSTSLTDKNVTDLMTFISNSTGSDYTKLSKMDRSVLSQVVNLNSDRFNPSLLVKFNNDQKLFARMSTQDNDSLKIIVVNIRDGNALTVRQVSDVKDFKTMISRDPYAFIPELYIITQYVAVNPNLFSSSDLAVFRQASRDASGITNDDMNLLNAIANRKSTALNQDDINVLTSLGTRAPIGSLNGLGPYDVIILNRIVNENSDSFISSSVSSFNRAYNDNQAIQLYAKFNKENINADQPSSSFSSPTSAGQR